MRRSRRFVTHRHFLGRDRRSRANALQTIHHDDVAFMHAFTNNAQAIRHGAKFYRPVFERVIFAEHKNVFLIQVRDDGFIFCQAAVVLLTALQLDSCEKPGREGEIFIWECSAQANRAGAGIDLVIDEIHAARMGKSSFIRETQQRFALYVVRSAAAIFGDLRVFQVGLFVHIEVRVNRIDGNQCG